MMDRATSRRISPTTRPNTRAAPPYAMTKGGASAGLVTIPGASTTRATAGPHAPASATPRQSPRSCSRQRRASTSVRHPATAAAGTRPHAIERNTGTIPLRSGPPVARTVTLVSLEHCGMRAPASISAIGPIRTSSAFATAAPYSGCSRASPCAISGNPGGTYQTSQIDSSGPCNFSSPRGFVRQ
jgi:hypothetical protein